MEKSGNLFRLILTSYNEIISRIKSKFNSETPMDDGKLGVIFFHWLASVCHSILYKICLKRLPSTSRFPLFGSLVVVFVEDRDRDVNAITE